MREPDQPVEEGVRVVARPAAAYAETSQNEQARNGCSSPGEAVHPGCGAVAQQQPVAHQVPLDRLDGAEHARVVALDEADRAEHQQGGVDLVGVVVLGEGVGVGVEARVSTSSRTASRISRQPSTGPVQAVLLDGRAPPGRTPPTPWPGSG